MHEVPVQDRPEWYRKKTHCSCIGAIISRSKSVFPPLQALEDRVPAFELNATRCFCLLFAWSFVFLFQWRLPRIETDNRIAAVLWSLNHIFVSLTAFISVVYIPLSTADTVAILSNILLTVFTFLVVLRRQVDWSQVRILHWEFMMAICFWEATFSYKSYDLSDCYRLYISCKNNRATRTLVFTKAVVKMG